MIRFVDLNEAYWNDPVFGHPICAFLSTSDDRFILTDSGGHMFSDMDDIDHCNFPDKDRLKGLVPTGFFEEDLERKYGKTESDYDA